LVALVFRDVGPILLEVYQVYFPHEVLGSQTQGIGMPVEKVWRENEKKLFEFFKDYDICPSLLSKSMTFQIYQHTKSLD
jgi:hypothetical protein